MATVIKALATKSLTRRFSHLNPDQYNGACLLGLRGTVIKVMVQPISELLRSRLNRQCRRLQRQVPQRIAARLESVYPAGFELLDGGKSGTLR
ncbi:hypothetical protein OIU92_06010 [Escherichia coli]|nr:hypothetical protein [Escherichia coli]